MTDWIQFPAPTPAIVAPPSEESATDVRLWLLVIAALVFAMVVVGGATRLTKSGLSITEWKPITGVLPPLSEAQWTAAFEDYKKIPQYREMFPNMDLARSRRSSPGSGAIVCSAASSASLSPFRSPGSGCADDCRKA